jgi:hypothetical protein
MNTRFGLFAAVFVAVSAVSALADTVDMRFTGVGNGRNVSVTIGSTTENVFCGQLHHTFSNGTGVASGVSGDLITYCTDLTQWVNSSVQHYSVVPVGQAPSGNPMGAGKASAIAALYDYAMGTQFSTTTSADMACAFQLAVWEVVTDFNPQVGGASLSLTSGNFRATQMGGAAIWSSVNTLLQGFFGHTNNSSFTTGSIFAVTSPQYQDQLVSINTMIPAPGSGVLAGLGLTLLASRKRPAKLA